MLAAAFDEDQTTAAYAADWPDDYQIQNYCAKRQAAGWNALND